MALPKAGNIRIAYLRGVGVADFATLPPQRPKQVYGGGMNFQIRTLDPKADAEVTLVAQRMLATLVEVIGKKKGEEMYTLDWLRDRVLFHFDPQKCEGRVFVAENPDGQIAAHCIVRVEKDEQGNRYGLFSTTYVEPKSRKLGIADALLVQGETWMLERKLTKAATFTDANNTKLISLYEKHGYAIIERYPQEHMVQLAKPLA